MTLRDKVDEAFKNAHTASGLRCETILSDTLLKNQLNAVMEVLDDYEALVEAVRKLLIARRKGAYGFEADQLEDAYKPFLPPPKLSDRLDEWLQDARDGKQPPFILVEKIANQLKEKGL